MLRSKPWLEVASGGSDQKATAVHVIRTSSDGTQIGPRITGCHLRRLSQDLHGRPRLLARWRAPVLAVYRRHRSTHHRLARTYIRVCQQWTCDRATWLRFQLSIDNGSRIHPRVVPAVDRWQDTTHVHKQSPWPGYDYPCVAVDSMHRKQQNLASKSFSLKARSESTRQAHVLTNV